MMEQVDQGMNGQPFISVIMNCFNGEQYLKEAIDSVYSQTYPNWEIIFWDNASSDRSAEIAKSYDKRLHYFRGEETISLGAARNKAIEQSQAEIIAFLDCDDVWLPDKLKWQAPTFEDPSVGLVYSDTLFRIEKSGRESSPYRTPPPSGYIFRDLLANYCISMETAVIRRKALDGLKEWFDVRFTGIEEMDLFIRIAHDWKVVYISRVLAKWRMHDASWTAKNRAVFSDELELLLEKYNLLYPGFLGDYHHEVRNIESKIAYHRALSWWKRGDGAGARRYLREHLFVDYRLIFVTVMTFFHYKYYALVLKWLGKPV